MNEYRESSVDLLIRVLCEDDQMNQFSESTLSQVSRAIEKGCHNANIDKAINKNIPPFWENERFVQQYSAVVYRVVTNLDPSSSVNQNQNPTMRRYLIDKIYLSTLIQIMCDESEYAEYWGIIQSMCDLVALDKLGYMNSDDLNPHINEPYKQQIKIRSEQQVDEKVTHMYVCPQCGARESKYRRMQTRSGDEGYTLFFTCKHCGCCWRNYT